MKFKNFYFCEKVELSKIGPNFNYSDFVKDLEKSIKLMEDFGSEKDILWRGFKHRSVASPVFKVSRENENYYMGKYLKAGEGKSIVDKIINKLGIKYPVFASFSKSTGFFGSTTILVPMKPYKPFQSPLVEDLGWLEKDANVNKIVKSYKNTIDKNVQEGEIIFDMKDYILLNIPYLFDIAKREDFEINKIEQLKTYADAIKLSKDVAELFKNK